MSAFSQQNPPSDTSHTESTVVEHKEHPLTEIVRFSIIAILIVLPIRMFVAQPFIVSGASMDNTFHDGQYLIVDQVTYYFDDPSRGDVVIFRYPRDPSKFFIKRVIGVPGDTITIEDAVVTIINAEHPDGFVLDEPYIKSMAPAKEPMTEILGDREYFVMGDNRDESSDSRIWGVLQEERIIGRALFRLFPPSAIDYLPGGVTITEELVAPRTIID
ncbi:signal peptidase I [Candidatus Nomurabacteria bacterium]|nr:signal peptidase I [Candidatus Nomurabacteria bacterium]